MRDNVINICRQPDNALGVAVLTQWVLAYKHVPCFAPGATVTASPGVGAVFVEVPLSGVLFAVAQIGQHPTAWNAARLTWFFRHLSIVSQANKSPSRGSGNTGGFKKVQPACLSQSLNRTARLGSSNPLPSNSLCLWWQVALQ